jgi:hypothetical protein
MTFKEFQKKQESIYSKFRNTSQIQQEGIVPGLLNQGGYIVLFKHPSHITEKLTEFSEKVDQVIPSITYNAQNAHTTISDYGIEINFTPDIEKLQALSNIICREIPLLKPCSIDYKEWLLNQSTGIAAGYPNEQFYNNVQQIINSAKKQGIELRIPWGAHMVSNRFKEKQSPEETSELIKLFQDSNPLGISKPVSIDISYFDFNPEKFDIKKYETFSLR